jgi:hypothetical protein
MMPWVAAWTMKSMASLSMIINRSSGSGSLNMLWQMAMTAGLSSTAVTWPAELPVAELGQCAGAQAQLHDVAGRAVEEHPRHHLLGVFQFDPVWFADAHRTLHPLGPEMQVAHAFQFGERHGGIFGFARFAGVGFELLATTIGAGLGIGLGFDGFSSDEHDMNETARQPGRPPADAE